MRDARTSFLEQEQRLLRAMRPRPQDVLEYDGWTVGFAANDAKRSRSVNALGPSTLPLDEKIAWCEQRYAERGLPPLFRLTHFSDPTDLDGALAARGYEALEPSRVMVRPAGTAPAKLNHELRFESLPVDEWLAWTGSMSGRPIVTQRAIAARLAVNGLSLHPLIAWQGEVAVAYGMTMLDGAYGGLFDIYVSQEARQAGVATALCSALIDYGDRRGTTTTWLSVLADNTPAHGLYAKLSFEFIYDYWYRVRPGAP